jgi:hypothetical protein
MTHIGNISLTRGSILRPILHKGAQWRSRIGSLAIAKGTQRRTDRQVARSVLTPFVAEPYPTPAYTNPDPEVGTPRSAQSSKLDMIYTPEDPRHGLLKTVYLCNRCEKILSKHLSYDRQAVSHQPP